MTAVTILSDFGAPKIKSDTVSTVSPSISHEVMGPDAMILVFWMLSFKPTFSLSSSRGFLVHLPFPPWGWCHLHIWGYWYFSQQSWFQLDSNPILIPLSKGRDSIFFIQSLSALHPVELCLPKGSDFCDSSAQSGHFSLIWTKVTYRPTSLVSQC